MNPLHKETWNPYIAGLLIGIVAILSFYICDKPLGSSTTFMRTAGSVVSIFAPEAAAENAIWGKSKYSPNVDWQFMFVFGIFLGSLISSLASGCHRV